MANEHSRNDDSKDRATPEFRINKYLCQYIDEEWFDPRKSNNDLADEFGVHDSIIAKIKGDKNYNIPVHTLHKMCFYKEVKMSNLLNLLEDRFGEKLDEDYLPRSRRNDGG